MSYDYLNLDGLRRVLRLISTAKIQERFFCKKSECVVLPAQRSLLIGLAQKKLLP
jgi:hypothetical protein